MIAYLRCVWPLLFTQALVIAVLAFVLLGCIPTIPEPVIITDTNCYLVDPYAKPKLPRVKYIQEFENGCMYYKCITKENVDNAREREIRLIQYANQMLDLYVDAQKRCNDQSNKE